MEDGTNLCDLLRMSELYIQECMTLTLFTRRVGSGKTLSLGYSTSKTPDLIRLRVRMGWNFLTNEKSGSRPSLGNFKRTLESCKNV